MAKCTSCDAEIFFAQSATTGALIPFDAKPVKGGSHIIDGAGYARPAGDGHPDQRTFVSHFTTCPNAAAHSKKRKTRQLSMLD